MLKRRLLIPLLLLLTASPIVCAQTGELTLEDIWVSRKYTPKTAGTLASMKDGEHYAYLNNNGICRNDFLTGMHEEVLLPAADFLDPVSKTPISVEDFAFSGDESKLLLFSESEPIYRYSEKSSAYVYDRTSKKMARLSEGGKQRLATFSPDATAVAFVRDNNLFVKKLDTQQELQLTQDGRWGSIINGSTDWVYEEELDLTQAFAWSPDGGKLAFMKFDESQVREFAFAEYDTLYPSLFSYKYPKAGEANSIVTVYVYDLKTGQTVRVETGAEKDQYIPRMYWTNNSSQLIVFRLNRLQNKLDLLLTDPQSGHSHVAWTETNKYYIDITDNFFLLKDNRHFLWLSERDGYNHIWKFTFDSKEATQLTKGSWDVITINAVNEKSKKIYYTASAINPTEQELYVMPLGGGESELLSKKPGVTTTTFMNGNQYYSARWSDANTPPQTTLHQPDGKLVRVLADNIDLQKKIHNEGFTQKLFFTFKTSEGVDLNGWMMRPADFDSTRRYPVLMYVYGGPNSQTVKNSWGGYDYLWYQLLTQKGYIVVSVDGRGTGARGEQFRKCTYLRLGELETNDQVEAAQFLAGLSYVDPQRIGIWGWSYGGYMTNLCMTKGAEYFKMGIAVAPVTNWRFYDNIYTERFMRTPQENPDGYDDNSPINYAPLLKGKLLLIHGGSDDNVHMQNTMEMVLALTEAGKQFEMQIYPNKNHSILGARTRLHLYERMTGFILKNL